MWAIPNSLIFFFSLFKSCFMITYLWQSSAICFRVIFGLFSDLFCILPLISASFIETNSCMNFTHLKLSAHSSASLKSTVLVYFWHKSGIIFPILPGYIKTSPSLMKKRCLWTKEFHDFFGECQFSSLSG